MQNKFTPKDLVSVGIFTAIYFIVFFACGMQGYVPILFILLPLYSLIITGIPVMLFLIGAFVGRAVLKKHFQKAGIV